MLKRITQGEWENNERTIQTVGGTYIGCASTEENAHIMACGPKLYNALRKVAQSDKAVQILIDEILKSR